VALARALAPQPRLLLLDEPFSNLDVDLRERLAQEVRAILKAAQATALFVTHDQLEAFAIGDVPSASCTKGNCTNGTMPTRFTTGPASRFVANFIGHGVFTPATLARGGPAGGGARPPWVNLTDMDECPLPCAFARGECDVLLRADDIIHDDDAPVKAEILRKAFRGSEFLYTLAPGQRGNRDGACAEPS
jgi:iron(III) transport system ATP-binding protein